MRKLFVFLLLAFTSCTVFVDGYEKEKSRSEKEFPEEQPTQTNTVVMTNSQAAVTNVVTNTVIHTDIITNDVITTNTIETVVTNHTVTNTSIITNTEYVLVTNDVYVDHYITNTLIQTNEYYYTNTVLSNVDNAIFVLLTDPEDGAFLPDTFTVSGYTPDGGNLAGAMVYIESTNEVMVQAQYSAFSGTSFSTTLTVDKEGHYFLWASAWDAGDAIGRSDKIYIVADWSAPEVAVTTSDGTNVSGILLVQGTAYDRVSGLSGVYLSVDGGGYVPVNGLDSWSHSVDLTPGSHTISVYSRDAAGYVSLSESISVISD